MDNNYHVYMYPWVRHCMVHGRQGEQKDSWPIRLPKSRLEILAKVNKTYDSGLRVWAETMVPKLLFQSKWFKSEEELDVVDLLYFPRADNPLYKKWIIVVVESLMSLF